MSADPNSFQETIFGSSAYDPAAVNPSIGPYVADYNRTGPDILGNLLSVATPGGVAIVAVDASQIVAGETFVVETTDGSGNTAYTTFEFTVGTAPLVPVKLADGNWPVYFKPGKPATEHRRRHRLADRAGDRERHQPGGYRRRQRQRADGRHRQRHASRGDGLGGLQDRTPVVALVQRADRPVDRRRSDVQDREPGHRRLGSVRVQQFGRRRCRKLRRAVLGVGFRGSVAGKIAAAINGTNFGVAAVASAAGSC